MQINDLTSDMNCNFQINAKHVTKNYTYETREEMEAGRSRERGQSMLKRR
jgi:hypothetical protein